MSTNKLLLQPNSFYHIFNRGINSGDLFFEKDNYEHFLRLYDKYISFVADTFAWVLMRNHFHLLVRIGGVSDLEGFETPTSQQKNLSAVFQPIQCLYKGCK